MKRIAMILNDTVVNIANWDGSSEWHLDGYTLIDITSSLTTTIGDHYNTTLGTFHTPELDVPMADQLNSIFQAMSEEVRAQFYGIKVAVQQAILDNDTQVAALIISNAVVPLELETTKNRLLEILQGGKL